MNTPTHIPSYTYGWADCFALLKHNGFSPSRILDVGANRGNWTRAAVGFFPAASYVMVEPQGHLQAHVRDLLSSGRDIRWITGGVSFKTDQLLLTLSPDEVSSSFLPTPEQASGLGFKQVAVAVSTIEEIVRTQWGEIPEMVKIDAEGYELKALAGAESLLGKTDIFFLEAAVCASGLDNTIASVVALMQAKGYKVIDITDINRSPKHGVLWLCELVFLREASPLLRKVTTYA